MKSTIAAALLVISAAAAHAAGTLSYCIDSAPEGFDMAQYETSPTFDAAGIALYDQLLRLEPGSNRPVAGLAESWQVSDDGLKVTLKLRANVAFHTTPWFKPTRTMNADDVLFSINRMLDKKHPAHAAARNGFVYWEGMGMSALVAAVDKLDAMTVRFTLRRPETPLLANLAIAPIGSVFSAEYADQLAKAGKLDQLNIHPVGTGPFVLKSYQKDAVIRYTAHPAYWAGTPAFDQLVFAITIDPDVRLQRLKAGECQVADLKIESLPQLQGQADLNALVYKPLRTNYLAPNTQRGITRDKRFREALWLAIDKAAFIRAAYGGRGAPATSFLPAQMWGLNTALKERQDSDRARQLVQASGYSGAELTLFVTNDAPSRRAGEHLQADWQRVGIRVRLQSLEVGELYKRTGQGEHDIALLAWTSDNADPDNFLTPNLACAAVAGGGNKARWCHQGFDALIDEARRITDNAKRTALYVQAQRIVQDEVAVIPLAYPERLTAVHRRVQGYQPSPLGLHDFRSVSLR